MRQMSNAPRHGRHYVSTENWFRVLKRAVEEDYLKVGVNHLRAARHPESPIRRGLYLNSRKVSARALQYGLGDVSNWESLWRIGVFQLELRDRRDIICSGPGDSWLSFVMEHCLPLLRR
jgi:hypothetical protein